MEERLYIAASATLKKKVQKLAHRKSETTASMIRRILIEYIENYEKENGDLCPYS